VYRTQNSGFTVLELLIVIALLGIFSSVVIATVGSARQKGVDGIALTTLKGTYPLVFDCIANGQVLGTMSVHGTSGGGGSICPIGPVVPWPKLPGTWTWLAGTPPAGPPYAVIVIQRLEGSNYVYYIGCGINGCEQNGPNSTAGPD
jgi:prepilin-type N-terminal cleavage/methylation domain-containing protein